MHEPKNVAEMIPPTLSYANPGFCALLRYRLVRHSHLSLRRDCARTVAHLCAVIGYVCEQDELLGCGLNNIVRVDMETIFTILPSLFPQRKAFAIGDPFQASFTWITKDKQAVNARTRSQYFFSKDGYVCHYTLPLFVFVLCFPLSFLRAPPAEANVLFVCVARPSGASQWWTAWSKTARGSCRSPCPRFTGTWAPG